MKYILKGIWLLLWWFKLFIFDLILFLWSFELYHFRQCDNFLYIIYSPNYHTDQDVYFNKSGRYSNAYTAVFYYVFE